VLDTAQDVRQTLPLRACVGIMLINRHGRIWLGRRRPKWIKSGHIWQMPQGGILRGESYAAAAFRELREETGVASAEIVAEMPGWLTYELPKELMGVALKGRYRGQRQKWFAMRFHGSDREIDVLPPDGSKPEFDSWRWVKPLQVAALAISFKRQVYEDVIREFAHALPGAEPLKELSQIAR
jgi:putative (di)nucleoside polyphosphate hydrolase